MIILTYNIHSGRGIDGRLSLSRIADVIRSSGADIACLQEVERWMPWGRFTNQPKRLAELMQMDYVFQPNLSIGPSGFGNMVMSKYPILSSRSHRLPSRREPRGLLEVEIDTSAGAISIFNTHWGLSKDERALQSVETSAVISAALNPIIICGDLNDGPESNSINSLISAANLHDLAAESGSPAPTFPSHNPTSRIDFILGTEGIHASRAFVVDSFASDHRAVGTEFPSLVRMS